MPRHRRTRGDADHDASYTSTVLSVETIRMEVIQENRCELMHMYFIRCVLVL